MPTLTLSARQIEGGCTDLKARLAGLGQDAFRHWFKGYSRSSAEQTLIDLHSIEDAVSRTGAELRRLGPT
jgi:hypothetical protein